MGTTVPMAQLMLDMVAAGTPERFPMSDDAVVWHNYDQLDQSRAENLQDFLALRAAFPDLRFEDARVIDCGNVTVAQWVFTVTLPDGSVLRAPGCSFVHEQDGLIVRVEEYIDSAQLAPLAAALGSSGST